MYHMNKMEWSGEVTLWGDVFIEVAVTYLEVSTDDILTTLDSISSARLVRGIWQPWITNYAYIWISRKRLLNDFPPTNFTNLITSPSNFLT